MKKYLIIILFISITFSSCKKFLDVNRDPDRTTFVPVENFLPGAEAAGLYVMRGNWQVIGAYWSQQWTQAPNSPQFQDYDRFQVGNSTFSRGYGTIFASALKELEYIRQTSQKQKNWALYLIATSLKAYNYQILVDLFDKVPYTEALSGDASDPITQPKFDEGKFIYEKLIESLDEALSKDFSSESVVWPKENDIIFGGKQTYWIKFANTMKLKLLLRERYADGINITSALTDLLADSEFLTDKNAGYSDFSNSPNQRNTIFAINYEHKGNLSISNTFISYMEDAGDDKRMKALINPAEETGKYYGIRQADFIEALVVDGNDTIEINNIKDLSTPQLHYDDYQYYFTIPEVHFMLAEANLIIGDAVNTQANYEDGILEHFKMIFDDATVALTNSGDVIYGAHSRWSSYNTDEERLEGIITQKWIASFNSMSLEAFIEHNRTGYPNIYTVPILNVSSGRFPHRFLIPQAEISNNSNTPQELISAQIYDKVWWENK